LAKAAPDHGKNRLAAEKPISLQSFTCPTKAQHGRSARTAVELTLLRATQFSWAALIFL
jgi:hypothetical protein